MKQSVMCIARDQEHAEAIVHQLTGGGFGANAISVLLPDRQGPSFALQHNTKAPEGALAGAGAGGMVVGVLGLLAGFGALAIPGIGPLIAAGPILAALSGLGVGATVGGLAGGLVGLGIPELEARRYEGRIAKDGSLLVSVQTATIDEQLRAEAVFKAADAEDILTSNEPTFRPVENVVHA
jgi:hypothetical protein